MATVSKQLPEVPFVDLSAEYRALESEILEAITRVLDRGDFILGRDVALFESAFANFCEARHAVGVDSGLSALELILRAYGIGPGEEVIVPANTFIASALAISNTGATPILVDVNAETYTMDIAAFESAITPRTAAVMPVHLYGHPVDMDPILQVARRHNLVVVEDACQAHGARYNGRRAGSLGDAAAFSFYPAKNLGCYGDGGIVVTSDSKIAKYVEMARNYGQREKYYHSMQGFNRRLDSIQAAVLRVKLNYLDERNASRRECAELYQQCLEGTDVIVPTVKAYAEPVWHLFVVRLTRRDELRTYLAARGINTGIHYPVPIHLQEAYRNLGHCKGAFPVTEACADQILSLPMFPELDSEMINRIAEAIHEFESAS